ncbi:MAG: T9SS type A sorting domain-containing protein [Flavobacteriaceae bacterium]|nr:T9SS type A sorting domain-containing protein [Flavobacteriaceae bacterium]
MKTITLTIGLFLLFTFQSFGQINPVLNLTWEQWYDFPNNFFILEWGEPEQPHDEIIGFNIYRENDFYIFISGENSIYNIDSIYGIISNCGGVDFLLYGNGEGFYAHVTAVYNPGGVESDYTETVWVGGAMIGITDYTTQKAILYPNPSYGILNIRLNTPLAEPIEMTVFDVLGKRVYSTSLSSENSAIDVSFLENGFYLAVFQGESSSFKQRFLVGF